ncbi:hypothetical protein V8D89_000938 [Ganoderma adspersum]
MQWTDDNDILLMTSMTIRPSGMPTQCRGAGFVAMLLLAAHATQTVMVDDGDPGIEYRGPWVHNPIADPKDLNYGGSVTLTNATGSTATYRFSGTVIAVFGAFEVAGTFAMHSTYSIDGGPAVDFLPASTIVTPSYRQKFFQSDTLSDGEHTRITVDDYVRHIDHYPESADDPFKHDTNLSTWSRPSHCGFHFFQPSGHILHTNNVTLTSTDAVVLSPSPTGIISQSQTSALVSTIPPSISAPAHVHSATISAGVIAGFAAAGLLVVILVGTVGWKCCRHRRKPAKRDDLAPYDQGLTALSFEPSEKQELGCDSDSRGSTVTSLLSLPIPQAASPHIQAPWKNHTSGISRDHGVLHDIQVTNVSGTTMGRDRLTGFEPLRSPSLASALLARHPRGTLQHKGSPVTQSLAPSRYMSPLDDRRRTATYRFSGTAIAVFDTCEMLGTFNVQSRYNIDSGASMDFVLIDSLNDEHTLFITNLGEELWLHYLVVTPSALPPPTSMTTASTASQTVQTTAESTAATTPPTTDIATATSTSASQPETTQSTSAPFSQTQSTRSFSNTESVALTSTDVPEPPPLYPDSASQSQTSVSASGAASPTGTTMHACSTKSSASTIAGVRRSETLRMASTATGLSTTQSVPAYPQATVHRCMFTGTSESWVPYEVRTTDLNGMVMGRDRFTSFEPLGQPSSASPPTQHPRGTLRRKGFAVTSSAGLSYYVGSLDERTMSINGGVRIARGPPENLG